MFELPAGTAGRGEIAQKNYETGGAPSARVGSVGSVMPRGSSLCARFGVFLPDRRSLRGGSVAGRRVPRPVRGPLELTEISFSQPCSESSEEDG